MLNYAWDQPQAKTKKDWKKKGITTTEFINRYQFLTKAITFSSTKPINIVSKSRWSIAYRKNQFARNLNTFLLRIRDKRRSALIKTYNSQQQ